MGNWSSGGVAVVDVDELLSVCEIRLNQESVVPVMLREDPRQERRMEWLMVSKAAVRSRRMQRGGGC